MTIRQLHRLKPLFNLRELADEAGLSYVALSSKLYRHGTEGRRSELTVTESHAIAAALARLLGSAGYVLSRPGLQEQSHHDALSRASAIPRSGNETMEKENGPQ